MIGAPSVLRRAAESELGGRLLASPAALASTLIVTLFVLSALAAPLIVLQNPHDLAVLEITNALKPPIFAEGGSWRFPLGTDSQGRDILSAIIYGSRTSSPA